MNLTRTTILASIFAASLSITSCGITANVKGSVKAPLPGGGHVQAEGQVGIGGETTVDITTTSPTAVCIKLCYSDSTGASLGCETVEVPASSQVPEGAVNVTATIVDCPAGEGGNNGGGGMFDPQQGTQGAGTSQRRDGSVYPGPVWETFGFRLFPAVDGTTNVNFSFGIRAMSLEAAEARRDYVLAGGIGTQTGPGFRIAFYSETEAQVGATGIPSGVRMRQAVVHDTFDEHTLRVNGAVVADLSTNLNVLHYADANGWDVVETFVPTSEFDTSLQFDNEARADWSTLNRATSEYATQSLIKL